MVQASTGELAGPLTAGGHGGGARHDRGRPRRGVPRLELSAQVIADRCAGRSKAWNDPAIEADNPAATLPATAITLAIRSDSSGTTSNFTNFLVQAAGSAWTLGSLGYLLGADQELLPQLGYAPLPSSIDRQAQAQLSKIGS